MTLSPSLQSSGDVLKSEYCFALVFPRATGFTASIGDNLKSCRQVKCMNQPRCEGFGRNETLIGSEDPS